MGYFAGAILIYLAILMHGCDVKEAGRMHAEAIRDAAKSCHPQPPPQSPRS